MKTPDMLTNASPSRQAVILSLAAVGFIVLLGSGMWLAVYSTRYVPAVVGSVGSAAVYLSSVFTPSDDTPALSVIPTASTTIPFGTEETAATATTDVATSTEVAAPAPKKQTWTPSAPVTVTGTTAPVRYSGLPDLAVAIEKVGYMATSSESTVSDGLIAASTIPAGTVIGVKFRVTNVGTNVSGPWTIRISIPSSGASADQVFTQDSLVPGQPSEYLARFDHIASGAGKAIVITIDPDHALTESKTSNNVATSTVTVL